MATTFNRDAPMAGLPPMHVLESDYTPTIQDKLKQEEALLTIKTMFEANLKKNVSLTRVSCPLFVTKRSGFNDNLNGVERPATFAPRDFQDIKLEVPFSLAKWKRWATVSGCGSLPAVSLLVSCTKSPRFSLHFVPILSLQNSALLRSQARERNRDGFPWSPLRRRCRLHPLALR